MYFDAQKTEQALLYIAKQTGNANVSKLVALKLIFLADRYHLRKYARTITGDKYVALKLGPVASRTKTLIEQITKNGGTKTLGAKMYRGHEVLFVRDNAETLTFDELSQTDKEALDAAIRQLTLHESLVDFTHAFPEWEQRWNSRGSRRSVEMDFVDFFRAAPESVEYCDFPQERVELSKKVFLDE